MEEIFLTFDELNKKICEHKKLVLFGASRFGTYLLQVLNDYGVKVDCFCDNNSDKWGTKFNEIEVISPSELKRLGEDVVVIISSVYVNDIYNNLHNLGIKNIFYLIDSTFSKQINKKRNVENVLLLCTDGLGDTVVRSKIIEKYIGHFDKKHVYIVALRKSVYDFLKLFTDNVMLIDIDKYYSDCQYRKSLVEKLNYIGFKKIISLNFHTQVIFEDLYVEEKYFNKDCSASDYILNLQVVLFNKVTDSNITLKDIEPNINKYFEGDEFKPLINIPKNYIVLGMGSFWNGKMYPVEKFAKVLQYLLDKNENIILLGNGKTDEEYYNELLSMVDSENRILNFTNKLSMLQSIYVIKECKLFIGVDSGLWNCSYALRKPSVVIYGGGNYGKFMHKYDEIKYVYNHMDCYGCGWVCKKSGYGKAYCIESIDYKLIIDNIKL